MSEINAESREIAFIGIDDDPVVLDGIKKGTIDATIAQNPYGHGYISMMLVKMLSEGYKPREGKYFVNSGIATVTADNVDSYAKDLTEITNTILKSLETEYLTR